ncbi:hypothetical protein [Eubacterium sp.]|uniref:hypothetical protein n=1 Tax=Eubacterium sp. TaxID=142586 RepID=UPI003EFD851B
MKKQLLIISITAIIVSIFISCSANSSSETVSTASVKSESTEAVTDSKENIVITESIKKSTSKKFEETTSANYPDTDVEFTTTEGTTISTTAKSTSIANTDTTKPKTTAKAVVDKDGWINKWY